jgi:hypothetical protein
MLRQLFGLSVAGAVVAASVTAQAVTFTNRDVSERVLEITEGGTDRSITIKPGETLRDVCPTGCSIASDDGESMDFTGTEVVTIEKDGMRISE